jgi:hypothetical protein
MAQVGARRAPTRRPVQVRRSEVLPAPFYRFFLVLAVGTSSILAVRAFLFGSPMNTSCVFWTAAVDALAISVLLRYRSA